MLSVKAIYDGEKINFLDEVKIKTPQKVIVTFLDEPEDEIQKEIYKTAETGNSFDFLKEPAEDIYTDKDLKVTLKIKL
jgi:hypothetical protein